MGIFSKETESEIARLCQQYHVRRLEIFGSAATESMNEQSDIDFILEFNEGAKKNLFYNYFGLKEKLELLLKRKNDLVMSGAIRNPYFKKSIEKTRLNIYG